MLHISILHSALFHLQQRTHTVTHSHTHSYTYIVWPVHPLESLYPKYPTADWQIMLMSVQKLPFANQWTSVNCSERQWLLKWRRFAKCTTRNTKSNENFWTTIIIVSRATAGHRLSGRSSGRRDASNWDAYAQEWQTQMPDAMTRAET